MRGLVSGRDGGGDMGSGFLASSLGFALSNAAAKSIGSLSEVDVLPSSLSSSCFGSGLASGTGFFRLILNRGMFLYYMTIFFSLEP